MRRAGPGGPSPRDTLSRDPFRHSMGPRSIGCRFGNPQKPRSRGEGPPAPARRRELMISDRDTNRRLKKPPASYFTVMVRAG
jgi:hypothetical protein